MADPDVHIREGPSHPDPEMRGGPGLQKLFLDLRPLVWSTNKGPPPGTATELFRYNDSKWKLIHSVS